MLGGCWVLSIEDDAFISSWSFSLVGKSRIDADDDVATSCHHQEDLGYGSYYLLTTNFHT